MSHENVGKKSRNAAPNQGPYARQEALPTPTRTVQNSASPNGQELAAQSLQDLEYAAIAGGSIYYKLVPDDGAKCWHVFAYWRAGPHVGHYVYATALGGELATALAQVARKVVEVERGVRLPTKDLKKGPRK